MTNPDLTKLLIIVDRSGSMVKSAQDMIGGLNTLFEEQAALPGKCTVDYVQFDSEYEVVFTDVPVADAKAVLVPRGSTALLDAIGKGMTELGEKLAAQSEDERPGTVIVTIATDGWENASREWTADNVKALIEKQRDEWNWDVVFLGANIDAVKTGMDLGVNAGSSMTYAAAATGATTQSLSTYMGNTRSKGANTQTFTDEDRKNAVKS